MAAAPTLTAALAGNFAFRPELADALWQSASEMDHLHGLGLTGRLDMDKIIVNQQMGRAVLNFQHIVKDNYTPKRQSEAIRAFGNFARLVAAKTGVQYDPLFEQFVSQLEQFDSLRRPHSFNLLLSHPYLILNRPEARNRIVGLLRSDDEFRCRLVDPDQLTQFLQSATADVRRQIQNENFADFEQLIAKLAADLDASDWLYECRLRAPLLSTHFLYHVISPISFIRTHPQDESGNSTLHLAAKLSSDAEIVRFLLQRGTDMSATNRNGWTPLHWAAMANHNAEVVTLLLDRKADPNAKDEDGHTPLHASAAKNSNSLVTRLLLKEGADPNSANKDGSGPLHLAARFNQNPAVINELLNFSAKVNAAGPFGQTPLHLAVKNESKNDDINNGIVALLLKNGAKIDAVDVKGRNVLHRAVVETNDAELIQFLLENGADVNSADCDGKTPLQLALEASVNREIIELLEDASGISRSVSNKSVFIECCSLS